MTLAIENYGIYKYEITDDLRLHVWNIEADASEQPPFYFQNEQLNGAPWESREQVENYFFATFGLEEEPTQEEVIAE